MKVGIVWRLTHDSQRLTLWLQENLTNSKRLMKAHSLRIILLPLLCLSLALMLSGCGTTKPKPVAWTIKITKSAAAEIDLVGVTAREKPRLEAYAMDKYWSPGDAERASGDKLTSDSQSGTWIITRKDPVWKRWLGRRVTGLFVIANLPGNFEGAVDPRREFLSIDKNDWEPAQKYTLEIQVLENRIKVITPEKARE